MDATIKTFIIGLVLGSALTLLIAPFCAPAYDDDYDYRGGAQHHAEGLYRDKLETQRLQEQYRQEPYIYKEPC